MLLYELYFTVLKICKMNEKNWHSMVTNNFNLIITSINHCDINIGINYDREEHSISCVAAKLSKPEP